MKLKPKIILIGGGGHCKSCIDVIESEDKYSITGILDVSSKVGQNILGYPIIGTDDEIPSLVNEGFSFFISVGQVNNAAIRIKIYKKLKQLNASIPVIVSSAAMVSKHAKIAGGTIVMHFALINAEAIISENCIINTKALIEHDTQIGAHTHVSTNATVNGNCIIGEQCFIGSGAIINQGIKITDKVVIGSGTTVINNIDVSGIYVGSPLKKIN